MGLYTLWYSILASGLVTGDVNIALDVVIALSRDTKNCFGIGVAFGVFQWPKLILASSIFLVLISISSFFSFLRVIIRSPISLIFGVPSSLKS